MLFSIILAGGGCGLIYLARKQKAKEATRYYIYEKKYEEYKEKLNQYNNALNTVKKSIVKISEKNDKLKEELNQDISSVRELLDKAYSANIIPLTFRNIQGIYYLYDYLSTSNQGLSEALMQCNLEAIKEKLDNVIKLQSKTIIQQAQANQALFEQNQQILETARATMNNTAVAAKYAQISAVNSELALKLQQKDLAYQKADFWLK